MVAIGTSCQYIRRWPVSLLVQLAQQVTVRRCGALFLSANSESMGSAEVGVPKLLYCRARSRADNISVVRRSVEL
jgi:hypothetical protein